MFTKVLRKLVKLIEIVSGHCSGSGSGDGHCS
jgi:hypothetical protein